MKRESSNIILIVEDDYISFKIAKAFFERLGWQVEHADTGEAAIELITQRHDDFYGIYLDIGLPIMKGIEVCKRIRAFELENPFYLSLPIIAVTANFSTEDAKEYISAGMQETFFKPLTPEKTINFLELCKTWHNNLS
ncbi:Aerobic respiration control sensor protein ArcB [Legionella massiliensis]|uniref:Aerobic respiration control sensor protein ArcB n=1 Tax=Legionella massiliensis TaxID=1034943 RepID=A0A078KY94_9GAMM|nr:response regulator [Legionella massiliensis]CDZ78017.1 Aerobic respiration control sensor protein ArcB [Legionella massiliensis]CEE13755.1 Aerobic respiration control sensor protein ArcB [Legionella massiliensis]